jgi:ATP-dependent Clp protease protease subunit
MREVRARGLEPPRLSTPGPKPGASANFATPAGLAQRLGPRPQGWRKQRIGPRGGLRKVQVRRPVSFRGEGSSVGGMFSTPFTTHMGASTGSEASNSDVWQRLLRNRIVFLGTDVNSESANLICAQLLVLAAEDPKADISFYINSPGGSVTDGLAIYDTMQYISCDVSTVCLGMAASMGQFLLCAGTEGKRFALPHSRILMHQPSSQMQGQAADIAIYAEQIIYLKRMLAERIAFHTKQPVERIEADSDRDRWFTAEEAKEYGFVDYVIEHAAGAPVGTAV